MVLLTLIPSMRVTGGIRLIRYPGGVGVFLCLVDKPKHLSCGLCVSTSARTHYPWPLDRSASDNLRLRTSAPLGASIASWRGGT